MAKAKAHRKSYEAPAVSSHACRWFETHAVDIVMTAGSDNPDTCVSDERAEPGDKPRYWMPKKAIR